MICEGKTKRCLPKYTFQASFNAIFSGKHWANTKKSLSFFNKIVFPHFKNVRKAKDYPDEQMSLIIMDTFKGQDKDEVVKLCCKNNCALIIVPHNLTKDKYNMRYTKQIAKQLNEGKAPPDVEVSLNFSEIKPLNAKWIYEMHEYLRGRSDLVLNGFESSGQQRWSKNQTKSLKELKTCSLLLEMIRTNLKPIFCWFLKLYNC